MCNGLYKYYRYIINIINEKQHQKYIYLKCKSSIRIRICHIRRYKKTDTKTDK